MSYERNDVDSFSVARTREAVADLATLSDVVIYCGAGVTIDKTGFNWAQLIAKSIRPFTQDDQPQPYISDDDVATLLDELDPQRVASVLRMYTVDRYPKNDNKWIEGQLRQNLYSESSGWGGGLLASKVARFAITLASLGREATIITTNYDVYIERAIEKGIRALTQAKRPAPGFVVEVLGTGRKPRQSKPKGLEHGSVRLKYLHGRLDEATQTVGDIILDEVDYALAHDRTVDALRQEFNESARGLIIVGASITDPPLIEALASEPNPAHRYALMPASALGLPKHSDIAAASLVRHVRARLRRLNCELIVVDFKVELQQFFDELILASTTLEKYSYDDDRCDDCYSNRLSRWSKSWSVGANDLSILGQQTKMLKGRTLSIGATFPDKQNGRTSERFKIEVWVRHQPNEKRRQLVLWLSSLGLLSDRELLKADDISLQTWQATTKALGDGKPLYIDTPKLFAPGEPPPGMRWLSYLAVPIYDVHHRMFLGAVSLASTASTVHTGLPTRDTSRMTALIEDLIVVGRSVLAIEPSDREIPAPSTPTGVPPDAPTGLRDTFEASRIAVDVGRTLISLSDADRVADFIRHLGS